MCPAAVLTAISSTQPGKIVVAGHEDVMRRLVVYYTIIHRKPQRPWCLMGKILRYEVPPEEYLVLPKNFKLRELTAPRPCHAIFWHL